MKKMIILIAMACFGKIAAAQTDTIPSGDADYKNAYITVQAGSVLVVKDSKTTKLDKDKTLKDGTIVSPDGTVKTSSGNTSKLNEGDKIYFDGRLSSTKKD